MRGKGDKAEASRVATASSDLDTAQAQWQSQAPYVFENLQALDEARIGNLRDALTQLQTHEMDQVERNRVSGEQCLNVLLSVETADEINSFAMKAAQGKMSSPRPQQRRSVAPVPSGGLISQIPSNSRSQEDLGAVRTTSTDDIKQKGRFKGLKRFGTVMGRKRDSKMPADVSSPSESPASQSRPSPLNSLGNRFRSRDTAPTLATMQETSPRERPRSPPRLGSEIFSSPSEARADPDTPPNGGLNIDSPYTNGNSLAASRVEPETRDIETPSAIIPERKESLAALEGRTDSEGFSLPPQNLDAISQAQQDAGLADDGTAPQFNVAIRDAPVQEDAGSPVADLASAANRLVCKRPETSSSHDVLTLLSKHLRHRLKGLARCVADVRIVIAL